MSEQKGSLVYGVKADRLHTYTRGISLMCTLCHIHQGTFTSLGIVIPRPLKLLVTYISILYRKLVKQRAANLGTILCYTIIINDIQDLLLS